MTTFYISHIKAEKASFSNDASSAGSESFKRKAILRVVDALLDFLALEKSLLVREIGGLASESIARAFPATFRVIAFILAHSYFWWVMGRPMVCSYLTFTAGGFCVWHSFSQSMKAASPKSLRIPAIRNTNVKWVNLWFIGLLWGNIQVVIGMYIILTFYSLFMKHSIIAWSVLFPDLTKLVPVLIINAALGGGIGLIAHAAKRTWEAAEFLAESILWIMYVTSGVFGLYATMPSYIQYYFWFNPSAALMENARQSIDPFVPVGDLSLLYSTGFALVVLFIGFSFHGEYRKAAPR